MSTIKAIIVEDEKEGMENIAIKISKHCPIIEIIEKCYTGESAIKAIEKRNPDLVFLDIRLGSMSGFDVLNKLPHIRFAVIFTTAFDQYAIEAIRVSAIDYLLKPIKPKELELAVEKTKKQLDSLGPIRRISVPNSKGFLFIPTDDIIYCLADNSYTKIFRNAEKKMILVTKTLKDIAQKLPLDKFLKISRSAYINLDYVDSFKRSNGGLVEMKNGDELSVSKDKRDELLTRMAR